MNKIKLSWHILVKRTRINGRYYGIMFRGIKIKWLPHHAVQIRNAICRFYFKTFRSFPPHLLHSGNIGLLQIHDLFPMLVTQNYVRFQIYPLISINKIIKRFRPIHSMSYIIKCQLLDRIRFIQTGSAQCIVIRIYILILTQGVKIECTSHRVNLAYRTGHPIPGSDFIFQIPLPVI